ncbi:MAG: hypothetical protein AAB427_08835, partial [Chloroflexota bacterium]
MPEETPRTLNHFVLFAFKDSYWALAPEARAEFHRDWLAGLRAAARKVDVYQVFPAESSADVLVWSALPAGGKSETSEFFDRFARATNPFRAYLHTSATLWGYTRSWQYT